MKRFIFDILIFFITLLIILLPIILYFSNFDNIDAASSSNNNIISLQEKSKFEHLDVLFVGNSYCYSSINTVLLDSLEISSYNLGIATAGVQFYELILNDYFKKINYPPKKIFFLVSPMTFTNESDNFDDYPIHRYLENPYTNFEIALKYNRLFDLVPMYKKSTLKGFTNLLHSKKATTQVRRTMKKGFNPSEKVVNDSTIYKSQHLYLSMKEDVFDGLKVDYLLNFVSSVKEKNIEVVFFELPTYKLNEFFSKEYLNTYERAIKKIEKKWKVIKINSRLFEKENFRDIDHMNISGARIATLEISKYLIEK